ncbi:unnamed protein product [Parajaminaea phylloscopi]
MAATADAASTGGDSASAPAPAHTSVWVNHESIPAQFAPLANRLVLVGAALGALVGVSATLAVSLSLASQHQWADTTLAATHTSPAPWRQRSRAAFLAPQLHLYLAAWATFHLLEFTVTARWNPTRLMKDSFLLQNGWNYHAAHIFGILEFILESLWRNPSVGPSSSTASSWPSWSAAITYLGITAVLAGQYLRSTAMIHAANNFSHQVAHKKRHDHALVTTGVYAWARHPSYAGFYLWAVGTQVLLHNPVSVCVFAVVLWSFFSKRVQSEERHLVDFFGDEYRTYRQRVWSGVPLVR